ncbi:hypothetical protein ACH9L7_00815 [Haloferax sp. S1W]|uniref:hypothetical protein n=1 Tax=Haloferax sp. S1W TaxID=3377110 RepID=UPI0037CA6C89
MSKMPAYHIRSAQTALAASNFLDGQETPDETLTVSASANGHSEWTSGSGTEAIRPAIG